jgi:tetratricopeptide (TPR) repeat protein
MRNRIAVIFAFFLACLPLGGRAVRAATESAGRVEKEIEAGLDEILRLQLEKALVRFEGLEKTLPDHPAGPFFQAYIRWWMMFEQGSPAPSLDRFQDEINKVFQLTRDRLTSDTGNAEMRLYLGSTLALEAKLKAMQHKNLGAAREADKAKGVLEECLSLSPGTVDANLNIGLYNYIIDSLPPSLKFLRVLASLSGGDKQEGLDQIRLVAEKGRWFKGEARVALAALLLDREYKTSSAEGLRWIRGLEKDYPENLYFPTWEAMYFSDNGAQADKAFSIAGRVREEIDAGRGNYTPALKRRVDFLYAGTLVGRSRLFEAVSILEGLQKDVDAPPLSITASSKILLAGLYNSIGERDKAVAVYKDVLSLDRKKFSVSNSMVTFVQRKLRQTYDPDRARFNLDMLEGKQLVSDGKYGQAIAFFQSRLEKYPDKTEVKFWLGLSHFLGGDLTRATEILQSISGWDRRVDPAVQSGIYLRLGQILDLQGRRKDALAFYEKVARVPGSPRELRLIADKYSQKPCAARELYPTDE